LPSESLLLEQTEPGAREATRTVYVKRPGPGGTFYYEPVTQKFRVPVGGEDEPQPRRGGGGDRLPPADAPIPPARNRDIPPVEADPVPFATPVIDLPPAGNAQRGEIHVIQLKNATPASMKNHISRFFEVDVSVDEDTGSLVIRCEKKTLEEIKKLVEQLDKPARGGA
jgi:Bacterial type II/III secretion system short domain